MNFLKNLLIGIISAFSPVAPIIYTLSSVILLDFIFGICRARKLKEEITSRKMSQSLPKILLYNSIILVLYFVDRDVLNTGIGLEKAAATLMIFMEMKSIDESFNLIFGYSLWNRLIESIERGKSITKK